MELSAVARKYTGNTDGLAAGARPGTEELFRLASKRFGFTNLGIFSNRRMNNDRAKANPDDPRFLSVHATGRGVDMGYTNRAAALAFWNFIIANTAELGIECAHDYSFRNPRQDPKDKTNWGAGYQCNRGEGLRGIVLFDAKRNAGTPNGRWIHVELSPEMADDKDKFRKAWIDALKRAGLK
jgi:hypothetical protein